MGGGAGGASFGPTNPNPGPNPWAQQIAALGPQAPQLTGQAAINNLAQQQGMSPQAVQAFLAQQANNPAGTAGPGAGIPGGMPVPTALGGPGGGGPPPAAPSSFGPAGGGPGMPPGPMMPRPGMGWGAPPGAGPAGVPPMGGTGMAGAGVRPGMPPGGAPAAAGPQAGMMGALAGRGAGAPGAGMPGAAPASPLVQQMAARGALPTPTPVSMGAGPAVTPQMQAQAAAQTQAMLAANPGLRGAGMGFRKGGSVFPDKKHRTTMKSSTKPGPEVKFDLDSTKPAPNNLPTAMAGKKMRGGGSVDPDANSRGETAKKGSACMAEGGSVDPDANSRGETGKSGTGGRRTRCFAEGGRLDSTKPAPGNLPTSMAGKKLAKGGVLRRKPPAVRLKQDRKSPSPPPTPAYDTPQAGADGWPPTPNFTSEGGPNAAPVPGMRRGGKVHGPDCDCADCSKMAKGGKWIKGAIKRPGALRRELGAKKGEPIPAKKLAKAAKAPGRLGRQARLAETLKGFKHAKGGECERKAAGGAAKQRRGFPNTIPHPGRQQKFAKGGGVRGTGAAQRGTNFAGIF